MLSIWHDASSWPLTSHQLWQASLAFWKAFQTSCFSETRVKNQGSACGGYLLVFLALHQRGWEHLQCFDSWHWSTSLLCFDNTRQYLKGSSCPCVFFWVSSHRPIPLFLAGRVVTIPSCVSPIAGCPYQWNKSYCLLLYCLIVQVLHNLQWKS